MSAFSSVILTFVFATYVASAVASEGAVGEEAITAAQAHGSQVLTTWQSIGAVAVALLAPLLGNLADRGGARNALLRITTLATVVTIALMPLVALDSDYLTLGAALIALAVVFSELAGVFVNSVLPEISSPADRGRISGTAWAVGYWGSIGCLGLVLVLFVMPGTGLLGITGEDGWNYRAIPLFVALWILVGTTPLMLRAPKHPASAPDERWNPWQGYAHIVRRVIRAFREEPVMLQYLVASAIYRDGLGAVFSIAGVLAANAYGFSFEGIIVFGIAANLVAGFGVYLGGKVDDRVGPRPVIIAGSSGSSCWVWWSCSSARAWCSGSRASRSACSSALCSPPRGTCSPGSRSRAGRPRTSASTPPPAARWASWAPRHSPRRSRSRARPAPGSSGSCW